MLSFKRTIQWRIAMPSVKYLIELTPEDRRTLEDSIRKGTSPARTIMRANVLLSSDRSGKKPMTVSQICETFHIAPQTVQNIKQAYCLDGIDAVLKRKKRKTPPVAAKVTGDIEAKITAIACSEPPDGRAKWTVRLIADRVVELQILDSISAMTVQRTLKKTGFIPT
jgi:hypothetical protein